MALDQAMVIAAEDAAVGRATFYGNKNGVFAGPEAPFFLALSLELISHE